MKIYICEKDFNKSKYLNAYFDEFKNIEVINNDFKSFIKKNKVECVVLSNNAYGLFDYGQSKEIIDYYEGIESKIQKFIIDNYNGEQPLGTSFILEANEDTFIIHTPIIRVKEEIIDERIVYQCMRTTLLLAKRNRVQSIVIPMFGCDITTIEPQKVSRMMRQAYDQIENKTNEITWDYANKIKFDI